jgi:Brp/Blh family beta-carotene 15,15'-monooxygenase
MKNQCVWFISALVGAAAILIGERTNVLPADWWCVPWLLSLVLFGLPHGALDHEVALRLWRPQPPPRWALPVILGGYLALVVVVLASWLVSPVILFLGFIALTWAHWGLADLWWSWVRDPAYFSSRFHRAIFAALRGALPMLVPLGSDPGFYRQTAQAACALFRGPAEAFNWIEYDATRDLALGVTAVLAGLDFILAQRSAWSRWLNVLEGVSLAFFFLALPALVSIGLYFTFWHGLRHLLRLKSFEGISWTRLTLQALPATLGALGLLLGLAWVTPHPAGYLPLLALYLVLISALTVPHALIVGWMDAREGLW